MKWFSWSAHSHDRIVGWHFMPHLYMFIFNLDQSIFTVEGMKLSKDPGNGSLRRTAMGENNTFIGVRLCANCT